MNRIKKLGKNIGLLTVGNFTSRLLSFLLVPLYTSVLSTSEFGNVDLIITTASLVYPLFILLISEAVVRFCLDKGQDQKQVFTIGFYVTLVGCCAMLLFSPIVLFTPLKDYYGLFILHCVTLAFSSSIQQFVRGNEKIGIYAIGGIINTTIVVSLNVLFLVVLKTGLVGYLLAMIIGHIVSLLYYTITMRLWKYLLPFKSVNKELFRSMIRYSVTLIPNSISWWISDSSSKYIVTYYCGVAITGIYAVSYKIPSLMTILTAIFISAWQLSAVDDFNSEESRKFFSKIANDFILLNLLLASWLIFFTKPLAYFLFSNDFYQAWRYTPILILAFVFNAVASFYGTVYTSAKKTKMLLYSTLFGAAINVVLGLILTPKFGAMGAAFATLMSYLAMCIIRYFDSRRIMILSINGNRIVVMLLLIIVQMIIVNIESIFAVIFCGIITLIVSAFALKMVFEMFGLFKNRNRIL